MQSLQSPLLLHGMRAASTCAEHASLPLCCGGPCRAAGPGVRPARRGGRPDSTTTREEGPGSAVVTRARATADARGGAVPAWAYVQQQQYAQYAPQPQQQYATQPQQQYATQPQQQYAPQPQQAPAAGFIHHVLQIYVSHGMTRQ